MNFNSPHTHCESPLTGSTIASMVDRAKALGREYFAYTDHGHLSSAMKVYSAAKKKGLKFVPGIEFYFKDSNCDIIANSSANRCKYFSATLYCQDSVAYQELCKMVSRTDFPTVEIYEEKQQLWSWKELEHMAQFNVSLALGGVHCMVGKTMLSGNPELAEKVFLKLQGIFKKQLFSTIVCETWTKKWNSVVEIELADGSKVSCLATDLVTTDRARRIKALDLTERTGHTIIKTISSGSISREINTAFNNVTLHKGFLPLPGGDALLKVNKFLKALANKHNVSITVSDYAYFTNKEDKIVQTMRLEGVNKLQPNFYMKSLDEVKEYLTNQLGMNLSEIHSVFVAQNAFFKQFDNLVLKYDWRLADSGPEPLKQAMAIIRENGRMKWDDPKYVARLKEELEVIAKNPVKDLTPYFLPIRDVLNHYKENGLLVGPGRGSAGGSLFCYLLGITQVNPFKYDLPFSRFFSMDRIMMKELPDIDVDLEERKLLVGEDGHSGYLYGRYKDKAAQISTRTTIRLKSAIKDTNRYFKGKVEPEIDVFSKGLPPPPQGVNDHQFVFGYEDSDGEHILGLIEQSEDLKKYAETRPQEWEIVSKAMGLTRAFSKHACISGDALVDDNGIVKKFKDCSNVTNKPVTVWSSGIKETVLVCLNNGITIRCTPDHKFICKSGDIEAKDLKGVEVNYVPFTNVSGAQILDTELLFALGWGLNDGTFNKDRSNQCFHFTPGKDDEARDRVVKFLKNNNVTMWDGRVDELYCGKTGLSPLFFESKRNRIQRLPDYFWTLTKQCQEIFMRGFMSANGYILNTRNRVGFKVSSKLLASDICIWMQTSGMKTSAVYGDEEECSFGGRNFKNNGFAEISLASFESRKLFRQLVGFEQTYKAKRLSEITVKKHVKDSHATRIRKTICLKVVSAEPEEVFDFNEPTENIGHVNGILVHNSAFVLSDVPIKDVAPVRDGNITQYEAKECEAVGLIKYDFLVINALKDVRVCLDLINKKNGKFDSNKPTDEVGWWHPESESGVCSSCEVPHKIFDGGRYMDVDIVNRQDARPEQVCGTCKKQFKDAGRGNEVGYFDHEGQKTFIWELPETPEVFKSVWGGACETLFQINTKSMIPYVVEILPSSIMDLATILALVRPGPLDFIDETTGRNMVEEYVLRKRGDSQPDIKELSDLLPETFGIITFQEQLNKIARDLAGFPGEKAEKLRKNMAKKKMKELMDMKPEFMAGAKLKVTDEVAEGIWDRMVTFGRYGFSIIHAVEYAMITYASMFLKHHYPLEWWAAVLTNATEQEITGKFWPFVKDMVSPPDINLSTDTMVVDYANSTIRSKFGVIRGIGETTIEPIVAGRPYKDIQDFVDKEVAGPSLTRKLVHVGVLDSLFPPRTNLLEKLKLYEDAEEIKKFRDKLKKAEELGKKVKATSPKPGVVPEEYVGLHPLKDAAMKKAILPSMHIDLWDLGRKYSKVISPDPGRIVVLNNRGYDTILINGERLKRLDEISGESLEKDIYVAATCFVVKAEEFSYPKKNPTKRALKIVIDSDGYVSEKVLWPEYESGQLVYPKEFAKGCISTIFFRKMVGRKDMSILEMVVET